MSQKSGAPVADPRTDVCPSSRRLRALQAAGGAVVALALSGCMISSSISDSVSSPFKWSSDSSKSSSSDKESSYQGDIRTYTAAYIRSSGDIETFKQGLTSVASQHGITNWEADQATYSGIGAGLGKAQVTAVQLEVYKTGLSRGDAVKAAAMQQGYEKYRN